MFLSVEEDLIEMRRFSYEGGKVKYEYPATFGKTKKGLVRLFPTMNCKPEQHKLQRQFPYSINIL